MCSSDPFTIDYDLPNDTCYTETCAAIGLAMWALRMLRLEPKEEYAAIMERALYNNVLSGISQDGEHYFYVNPLLVKPEVARFRRDHQDVEPDRVKWFGCACCPPNITRTLCGLGGYIYTRKGDAIYQHLYIGNTGEFETEQGKARLRCVSSMPWEELLLGGDIAHLQCLIFPLAEKNYSKNSRSVNILFHKNYDSNFFI